MHRKRRPEVADEAKKPGEAHVCGVPRLGDTEGRRMRDEDVELAPSLHALEPHRKLEAQSTPAHLSL